MSSPTVWCPSCGAEYVAGTPRCADCRVALVPDPPTRLADAGSATVGEDLVEIGSWPRIEAQILRARLESAGISVMIEWSSAAPDADGTIIVPERQGEFADAVVNELDVDDEVPDTSPFAYVTRLEEHLAAVAELLAELRTRLDELEARGVDLG
jgi:hypothetical protein